MKARRVLIVGQNPSRKNKDINMPFTGTNSGRTLLNWINFFGLQQWEFQTENASNIVGRTPKINEIRGNLNWKDYTHIIALGRIASLALLKSGAGLDNYFRLPHPSGLNRQLNDKVKLQEILDSCKLYLEGKK